MYLFNSAVAALTSTFVSIILGTIAGYSFSRFNFRGKDSVFLGLLLTRCIPGIALSLPLLILFGPLGLVDTLPGLVIVYSSINTPFITWMMEGFFMEVPRELDEAAYIDGCSKLRAFTTVDLPLARTGIISSAALAFLLAWVEYPISFVLTSSMRSRTTPPGIFTFMTQFHIDWGGLSAAATILTIPAIIFIALTQKYIVRGLTFGAVRG
jgi:multiple sugar transport system permease protein